MTAIITAPYTGHRDASDQRGDGAGFLVEDGSSAEECFWVSAVWADLVTGVSDMG